MAEIIKDGRGRTVQRVPAGGTPPPIVTGGISKDAMKREVEAELTIDSTALVGLDIEAGKITDDRSVSRATAKVVYGEIDKEVKALNEQIKKLALDRTKTPAKKLLIKQDLTEKTFGRIDAQLATLSQEIVRESQAAAQELFTADLDLVPTEANMMPIYAKKIAQEKDIAVLVGSSSKAESKIALNLSRDYPHLVGSNLPGEDFNSLARTANFTHTPEAQHRLDELGELNNALHDLTEAIYKAQTGFIPRDVIEQLKKEEV